MMTCWRHHDVGNPAKMTTDLIECDEYKMTNPYCASKLTREFNKSNNVKNGSCIVTNFATDKYIFSDGKCKIIYFYNITYMILY